MKQGIILRFFYAHERQKVRRFSLLWGIEKPQFMHCFIFLINLNREEPLPIPLAAQEQESQVPDWMGETQFSQ